MDSKPTYVKKTDENGQSIVIGESVTTTLKDPQGNVRKITTIESYDADKGIESWKHILQDFVHLNTLAIVICYIP